LLERSPKELRHWEWYYVDRLCHRELLTLGADPRGVIRMAFSPDGRYLAYSSSDDKKVKVWDLAADREVLTFPGHGNPVVCVAFSPDGKRIASGSMASVAIPAGLAWHGEIKVWDMKTGQEALTLKGHTYWVTRVAFSP